MVKFSRAVGVTQRQRLQKFNVRTLYRGHESLRQLSGRFCGICKGLFVVLICVIVDSIRQEKCFVCSADSEIGISESAVFMRSLNVKLNAIRQTVQPLIYCVKLFEQRLQLRLGDLRDVGWRLYLGKGVFKFSVSYIFVHCTDITSW